MPKDFLLDEDGDLLIRNGDLVVGESTRQHQSLLLSLAKGEIKEFPVATVGLNQFLESEDPAQMIREIRLRFTQDGQNVKKIAIEGSKLKIEADYK